MTRRRQATATLFVAPFLLLFLAITITPLAYAAWLSLFTEKASGLGFGGAQTVFAGLDNYVRALSDAAFRNGFAVIAAYCLLYIPLMIGGALVLALLLDSALARMKRFFQVALFLPHAVPGLIAAIIWVYLYTPGLSPIVDLLQWDFLSADHALLSVVNIATWQWIGYNMIIFYAALQAVPREVLEAATVDGAGGIRTAWSIKVPLIRAAVVMAALFTVIGAIQLFTEPKIMNRAASTVGSSWTPNMYAFTAAFDRHDYGLAAAASLLIALLGAVLSFVVTRATSGRKPR
ncbi:multiple sugar transport system permease protein [Nonomuraea thailandensis]|uniref:Multiple sugar transport system permease protein n=1 Tax=Nonomuraea thailandensis TaxID=1188745 RepID=A0A9X2GIB9_9ACTN|nr:sugar ABC transporter permease [Nonomuraea thailandensis]MCP2358235.1 multiple sugar transport system permease protein [Nonomuraea thailandensis]